MSLLSNEGMSPGIAQPFPGGIAAGASVRTPCGLRRIEMLRPGDLVVTRDNGLQPVRRIWSRSVPVAEMLADRRRAPICFRARALGPMLPARRIMLAPEQRLLVPGYRLAGQQESAGCLVAAGDLAESAQDIARDILAASPGRKLRYFVLLFDSHQLFCADGLPVESFLATAGAVRRLRQDLRADLLDLFPQLRLDPNACAPVPYKVLKGAQYIPDRA